MQDVEELINRPGMCSQQYHENQPLEFYCEECEVPICHKCSVVSHNRHSMIDTESRTRTKDANGGRHGESESANGYL